MSDRNQNLSVKDQLRIIFDRLTKLESQNNKIRKNDVRLSDTIVTADSPNNQLCLQNLVTNEVVCIGAQEGTIPQAIFSFSGSLIGTEGSSSAPHVCQIESTAIEIVVACWDSFADTLSFCVSFEDAGVDKEVTLNGALRIVNYDINVPVILNDKIRVTVTDGGTAGQDIGVFVRFGTPTVGLTVSDCPA
jgi:hypothetical protein